MFDVLEPILVTSGLAGIFDLKQRDDHTSEPTPWVAYRVKTNIYKIRSFELWNTAPNRYFRTYHAPDINKSLKTMLKSLPGVKKNTTLFVDYITDDYIQLTIKSRKF
ncbi:hypothetical protein P9443_17695 [Peribacillus frigoritolerans]|uniref:hypothetical protein n=1 Tax=Peribacillus frigoritolerans TaxID=450367 RepID=UPI002E204876|nr:hypothetical protein [Peribacillus frigoritolerans]